MTRRSLGIALLGLLAAGPAGAQDAIEELLRLHAAHRTAHVLGDAAAFTATFADTLVDVSRGAVSRVSRDDARARFGNYFGSVRFLEWEDVAPPGISLAPDGRSADVLVRKRVRLIAGAPDGQASEAARYAWLGRWERGPDGWRLTRIVSTERAEGPDDVAVAERVRAFETLRRAREAVGGDTVVANTFTLAFAAECEGPRGAFRTEVVSGRDGRVAFRQEFPTRPAFGAGIHLGGAWQRSGDTRVDSLPLVLRTVMHSHELHLLAIAPEARFTDPRARPDESLDGRAASVVRFSDLMDAPVDFLFDADSGLPLGFRIQNHTGNGPRDITVHYADWRSADGLRLPYSIEIVQGADVYQYRVTEASAARVTDAAFRPGSRGVGGAG